MGDDAMLRTGFRLKGSADAHRVLLEETLKADKWRVAWSGEWKGTARLGKKAFHLFFGALAQYYEIGFELVERERDGSVLHIYRVGDGALGGLVGMHKVRKRFEAVSDHIRSRFRSAGMLAE